MEACRVDKEWVDKEWVVKVGNKKVVLMVNQLLDLRSTHLTLKLMVASTSTRVAL